MTTEKIVMEHRFIQPLDVLFLRGNKLFGDAGSHGESMIPPWPSVAAGALRSALLVHEGVDLAAFASGKTNHPLLGTPSQPSNWCISFFQLARKVGQEQQQGFEALYPIPCDVVISGERKQESISRMSAMCLHESLASSAALPMVAVLAQGKERSKPLEGYWLTQTGWQHYLAGKTLGKEHIVHNEALWKMDARVGIGLSADTRSAEDGKLFTVQAVALHKDVGFIASASACGLPEKTMLRMGGDGRAASSSAVEWISPQPDYAALSQAGSMRMILTSPAIFTHGWLPHGCSEQPEADGSYRFALHGVSGRIVCAALPRAEVVSGFDLARWQPKAAQRALPAGSVYWLQDVEATPEALSKLAKSGLWSENCEDTQRRAEGFNQCSFAPF